MLKIDRSPPPPSTPEAPAPELSVIEDQAVYNEGQAGELLRMIEEGNRGTGGLEKVMVFYGVLGFVRFTQGWYMVRRSTSTSLALLRTKLTSAASRSDSHHEALGRRFDRRTLHLPLRRDRPHVGFQRRV